jgi:hypothetical protein
VRLDWYFVTSATLSSVFMAASILLFTNARCGRSMGTCDAMRWAYARSRAASFPVFGLAYV